MTPPDWILPYRRGALCAAYVFLGVGSLAGHEHERLRLICTLGLALALLYWCTLDAARHGKELVHGLALPFLFTWPVALLVHLVWTRGPGRGVLLYLGGAALATLAYALIAVLHAAAP